MAGLISALDAAWFAVLVLYVVRDLHQQPGAYGLLLAIGALGGVTTGGAGAVLTRRLGPWRSLLLGGVAMAASQAVLGLTSNTIVAAAMLFSAAARGPCSTSPRSPCASARCPPRCQVGSAACSAPSPAAPKPSARLRAVPWL